jgi:hypothetical protein
MRKTGIIVPALIEPNGKMKKFLEVARDPKVQAEYGRLLHELKANPKEFGRKLREVAWKGKDVERIYGELVDEKSK